ncbi:MAG: GGDEF domain-containing protein [Planctomycetota bacterium]
MQTDLPIVSPLTTSRPRYDIVAVCVVLSLIILALDLAAPMGIASGALYVTAIMFSLLADNARITWSAAWGVTVMTVAAMVAAQFTYKKELHEAAWILLVNRGVALLLVWMTASLGVKLLHMKRQVVEHGIELERMNVELNKIARHDALTGVANRRYFDERLNQELLRAIRDKMSLSLLMIDVDFFKKYNDVNGHQAGDACLIKVAQTIQGSLRRPADMAARYGGEEFAVILPSTTVAGAVDRAETIRAKIEALQIAHPGSHRNTSVTVSIGLASIAPGETTATVATLISAADAALYQVKQSGRNAVKVGGPV